jgi:hypothetical protein
MTCEFFPGCNASSRPCATLDPVELYGKDYFSTNLCFLMIARDVFGACLCWWWRYGPALLAPRHLRRLCIPPRFLRLRKEYIKTVREHTQDSSRVKKSLDILRGKKKRRRRRPIRISASIPASTSRAAVGYQYRAFRGPPSCLLRHPPSLHTTRNRGYRRVLQEIRYLPAQRCGCATCLSVPTCTTSCINKSGCP